MPKDKPSSNETKINRRYFFFTTALAGGSLLLPGCATGTGSSVSARPRRISPNEKLNIAVIGAGGKGSSDTDGCASENIVALCDVDEKTLNSRGEKYPNARKWRDYRKMLAEQKDIDAVIVSTPDHHHAPAAMMAMQMGKHAYVQKPLAHSVYEARAMAKAARRHKVATLMGNQGHSGEGVRRLCEVIWAGVIGPVREVHSWTNRPIWPQGVERPAGSKPVPANLDWDLFLGPAPFRPYNDGYHPFAWRGFWDFGTGALGDMGCHLLDPTYSALKLVHPLSIEAESSGVNKETAPKWAIVTYQFPARKNMPPVKLVWYDGGKKPSNELLGLAAGVKSPDNGTLYIGDKGKMTTETYGESPKFTPDSKVKEMPEVPKTLVRSAGHYKDWINACKGTPLAGTDFTPSHFDYAGPFTEIVLLGNLAVRAGKKLDWDAENLRARNAPEVAQYIRRQYRAGWNW